MSAGAVVADAIGLPAHAALETRQITARVERIRIPHTVPDLPGAVTRDATAAATDATTDATANATDATRATM
jgi:hypothetical protein